MRRRRKKNDEEFRLCMKLGQSIKQKDIKFKIKYEKESAKGEPKLILILKIDHKN